MTQASHPPFLDNLPVFARFEDVANLSHYKSLPDGWALAVADVVSSGAAIAAGKYKMVNMAGAAVITAVLNALGRADYPFVFGGDGAVIALPGDRVDDVRAALASVARWIAEDLALEMRVALVPVADIQAAGLAVQVARFQASPDLTFAMFAGGGAAWAERQMKAGQFAIAMASPGSKPDLAGLSCRWNPLQSRNGHIVSIIAVPAKAATPDAFRTLVADVVAIANSYGGTGNPLPDEGPHPTFYLGGMAAEVRASSPPDQRFRAKMKVIFEVLLTWFLHRTGLTAGGFNARNYLRELVRNTDFRKYDDGLKMTLDVDDAGLARIEARLAKASDSGTCDFGLHRQDSALVTCIVPSVLSHDHMHFIDGASGGYAEAASQLKAKAKNPATGHVA